MISSPSLCPANESSSSVSSISPSIEAPLRASSIEASSLETSPVEANAASVAAWSSPIASPSIKAPPSLSSLSLKASPPWTLPLPPLPISLGVAPAQAAAQPARPPPLHRAPPLHIHQHPPTMDAHPVRLFVRHPHVPLPCIHQKRISIQLPALVTHQPHALNRAIAGKLTAEGVLAGGVLQPGHKQRRVRVSVHFLIPRRVPALQALLQACAMQSASLVADPLPAHPGGLCRLVRLAARARQLGQPLPQPAHPGRASVLGGHVVRGQEAQRRPRSEEGQQRRWQFVGHASLPNPA